MAADKPKKQRRRRRRSFTPEFKAEAVRLVLGEGKSVTSGRSDGDVAVAVATCEALARGEIGTLLFFEDETGAQLDFDLRGSPDEVVVRVVPKKPAAKPGRPKLGVVGREVSLLPRHWAWLERQPSGASAALRRLVDDARKHDTRDDRRKQRIRATGRVMTVMAGNRRGFEEALRALYADDFERFGALIAAWPEDVRTHLFRMMEEA